MADERCHGARPRGNDVKVPAASDRPRIPPGLRLQWEEAQQSHVLLYPEGMVKLNASAGAILARCDGVRTVADIIGDLERSYGATDLGHDVGSFIALALEKRWLELAP
ncbi:MAG: pyrroloquinoline quinone biosynthesis peptide chaperone PqqD [Gammaproteobacteria bacterium]|nr:pyrroloquinoline quinone biosynthesis peptide chaperone PqqD [Gammaproteobacteria bacterium]